MRTLHTLVVAIAALGIGLLSVSAWAADTPPAEGEAHKALQRDAACTGCHNEGWPKPVLAIYQTPHGNRADPRAPNCQSCHGESAGHQKDPAGVHPDVVFDPKQKISTPEERNGACLACHQTGLRMH